MVKNLSILCVLGDIPGLTFREQCNKRQRKKRKNNETDNLSYPDRFWIASFCIEQRSERFSKKYPRIDQLPLFLKLLKSGYITCSQIMNLWGIQSIFSCRHATSITTNWNRSLLSEVVWLSLSLLSCIFLLLDGSIWTYWSANGAPG